MRIDLIFHIYQFCVCRYYPKEEIFPPNEAKMNKISIPMFAVGAIIVIVVGIVGFSVIPKIIENRVEEQVSLYPMSETWEKWTNIDKPLYLSVYLFNVTNIVELNTSQEPKLPKVEQLGPYVYRQRRRKINHSLHDGERLVSYEEEAYYYFDRSRSVGSESDELNVFNYPFYLMLVNAGVAAPFISNLVLRDSEKMVITRTVGEMMFQGLNVSHLNTVLQMIGGDIPEEWMDGRFSVYKGRNESTGGVYKIHTGVGDSSLFGEIMAWNGKSSLGFWEHMSECDKIKGTDGTIFPPFVTKDRIVHVFSTDICRSIYLHYEKDEEVKGINGYKFVVPDEVLADPRNREENRCYCDATNVTDCLHAGVMNVSTCRNSAPFILSLPHFLSGYANYSQEVGLIPDQAKHETALVIEPTSGLLLKANKRIQVNMDYKQIENVFVMNGTGSVVFPILWIDENVEFTDENANDLNDELLKPKRGLVIGRWVGIGVGIALILGSIAIYVWKG